MPDVTTFPNRQNGHRKTENRFSWAFMGAKVNNNRRLKTFFEISWHKLAKSPIYQDGDGVPTYWLANAIGFDADGWTEKSNHPDIKEAIEAVDWFLYNKGGKEWAENCGPLKPAFRAVLREIKKRLEETDWSPCRCKRCTEYRRKNAIKQSPES
jgi:hypothetical protein